MDVRVALAVAAVVLAAAAWLRRRWPDYRLAARLPGGPWALPFLGHTYLFLGYSQESLFARLRVVLDKELSKLPYAAIWLGPQLVVAVTGADCVEKVIFNRSVSHKGDLLHAADKIAGNGMTFGSGPDVKRRRRGIQPSLKMRMLETYLHVFYRHAALLQQVLKEKIVDGEEFYLEKNMHYCAFDVVNETIIGVRTNCQLGENRAMAQDLIDIYGLLYQEVLKPWLYHSKKVLRLLGFRFRDDRIADMLERHIRSALERKKAELQNESSKIDNTMHLDGAKNNDTLEQNGGFASEPIQNGGMASDKPTKNGDLMRENDLADLYEGTERPSEIMTTLEYILRSDFEISDDDITLEVKNILLASSDTVAQISSFLFKMLAVHPEYQERAYREVLDVLGAQPAVPSAAQLARLVFLDQCVKETIRLFPIAPLIPRKMEEPLKLDDKLTVHAGATLLVGAFWLHRSPSHWVAPEAFRPEHFAPAEQNARHRAAYLAFSGGAHSCIGQQYAMLLIKMLAAMVLVEFRVEAADSDYVLCKFNHEILEGSQNTAAQNGAIQDDGSRNDGIQNGVNRNGRVQSDHAQNEATQNGGTVKRISRDNRFKEKESGFQSNSDEHKDIGDGSQAPCPREGCAGRYIPEDYVAKMNLGTDISVRLVGGIFVKMYRRTSSKLTT